jgi:hypothetical protein
LLSNAEQKRGWLKGPELPVVGDGMPITGVTGNPEAFGSTSDDPAMQHGGGLSQAAATKRKSAVSFVWAHLPVKELAPGITMETLSPASIACAVVLLEALYPDAPVVPSMKLQVGTQLLSICSNLLVPPFFTLNSSSAREKRQKLQEIAEHAEACLKGPLLYSSASFSSSSSSTPPPPTPPLSIFTGNPGDLRVLLWVTRLDEGGERSDKRIPAILYQREIFPGCYEDVWMLELNTYDIELLVGFPFTMLKRFRLRTSRPWRFLNGFDLQVPIESGGEGFDLPLWVQALNPGEPLLPKMPLWPFSMMVQVDSTKDDTGKSVE